MSDSKEDEETKEQSFKVVDLVREFCMSSQFESEFEKFAEKHYEDFKDVTEMKDSDEHRLEYYDIYSSYLAKFEGKIEKFLEKEGYDPKSFYAECRTLLEDEDNFGIERFFVEALLATSEYNYFFMLMKGEMMRLEREKKSKK